MLKLNGITFKTFIFTCSLITLVVAVSFGILYLVLPDYYFYTKNKTLQLNTDILARQLEEAQSIQKCSALIADFAADHNVTVLSFDEQELIIPDLSSPFILMNEGPALRLKIGEMGGESKAAEDRFYNITIVSKERLADTEIQDIAITETEKSGRTEPNTDKAIYINDGRASTTISKKIDNAFIGYITINGTLQPIDEANGVIVSLLPYLLLLDIAIALIASYYYSQRLTRPILQISDAAAQMQQMIPGSLSNVRTRDELGQLSQNLDSLYLSLCDSIENIKYEMDKVQQLQQSKIDFMRSAGHDLKTPIAALSGMLEGMLDNVGVYKNKDKYLVECKNLVDKLAGLVHEILNTAKLENLEETVVYEDITVNDLLEQALSEYQLFIEEKELQIVKELGVLVYKTDEKILYNILANLISNAVKYTDTGGKINLSLFEQTEANVLSIENQCAPIPEDKLPQLFEPFYTLNYSRDKTNNGTGLGLYIVKRNLETLHLPYKLENTEPGLKFSLFFAKKAG